MVLGRSGPCRFCKDNLLPEVPPSKMGQASLGAFYGCVILITLPVVALFAFAYYSLMRSENLIPAGFTGVVFLLIGLIVVAWMSYAKR